MSVHTEPLSMDVLVQVLSRLGVAHYITICCFISSPPGLREIT